MIDSDTFVNVVPAKRYAEGWPRPARPFAEIGERMLALRTTSPDVRLEVEAGPVRPVFEPSEGGLALFRHALQCAREIGLEPGHGIVGGGSASNFTAHWESHARRPRRLRQGFHTEPSSSRSTRSSPERRLGAARCCP